MNQHIQAHRPVTFRHFRRAGFALFAALGKEVRVGILSVATLTCAAPRLALAAGTMSLENAANDAAETIDGDTVRLGEALITASRASAAIATAANVQAVVMARDEINAPAVRCLNDALKNCPAVDVRQRGSFGMQTDVSIDGGTFDQIAFFLNGFALLNPQTGHNAADLPINTCDVSSVEVVAGAASRVFGTQAFSGAVNVITALPDSDGMHGSFNAAAGSYGTLLGEARGEWRKGRLASALSVGGRRSDGAVDNGDFSGAKAFWQGRFDGRRLRLDAQLGLSANDFGANTFYSAAYPDQWEATRRYFLAVRAESKGRIHLAPEISWTRNADHFQLIRHSHTAENFHRGDVFAAGLRAWTAWALGQTAIGAEVRRENILSNNLGRPLDESIYVGVRGQDSIYYTRKDGRTNLSFFAEHALRIERLSVSAGVLAQWNSDIDGLRFYPGINASLDLSPDWRLYASWNKALRLPTFTDLYYKSPTQEGNTDLKAEENSAFRLGAAFCRGNWKADARAFYNRGSNMIDWVMRSADDIYHATNFQLSSCGVSVSVNCQLSTVNCQLSYSYIHQKRRDDIEVYKSNYALEYVPHKFTASLSHPIWRRLHAAWNLRLWKREGNYIEYVDGASTGTLRPYGTHAVVDARLAWTQPQWEVYADLHNLTATRYYDLGNVRQPRCIALVGAKIKL